MYDHLYEQEACPLCGCKEYTSVVEFDSVNNSYAEIISDVLNYSIDDIFRALLPSQCVQCDLIYFKSWFKPSIRDWLYQERVPNHPAGWKAYNSDFLFDYTSCQLALNNFSQDRTSRNKRILIEFLSGISYNGITPIAYDCLLSSKSLSELKAILKPEYFDRPPRAFSKYSMFSSDYLINKISKILSLDFYSCKYAEIGCPLWGFLPSLLEFNSDLHHFQCRNDFWGSHCTDTQSTHCSDTLPINHHYLEELSGFEKLYFDCICAFASLDHFPDLGVLIKNLLRISKKVIVLNEECSSKTSPPPMQHICNLDAHSLVKYFNSTRDFDAQLVKIDDIKYSSLVIIGHKYEKN